MAAKIIPEEFTGEPKHTEVLEAKDATTKMLMVKGTLKIVAHRHSIAYFSSTPAFRHKVGFLKHVNRFKNVPWNASLQVYKIRDLYL